MQSDKNLSLDFSQQKPGPQVTTPLEEIPFGTLQSSADPRVVGETTKRDPSEGEPEEEK